MSKYTNVKVNISEGQRKKLKSALENRIDQVSIHLDPYERRRRSRCDKETVKQYDEGVSE